MTDIFYKKINVIIDIHVPKRKPRKAKHPAWFTRGLCKILSEKDKLRKRYRIYSNPRDKLEYEIMRKRCDKLYLDCYRSYMFKTEKSISSNPKTFWKYVKDKKSNSNELPAAMKCDDVVCSRGEDIADLFARHFSSTFTGHNGSAATLATATENYDLPLHSLQVDERTILRALKKLDPNKGAGPDNLPPLFIKRCAPKLALPLKMIINKSLDTGIFPTKLKEARIVPVLKKGNKDNIKNYRPISILSTISKVFESVVCPVLTHHVKPMINPRQHGFQCGKSVSSNLVSFITNLTDNIDKKIQVDAIYTDFSSAFDKVNHRILLRKLAGYGVIGSLNKWFGSYLAGRSSTVVINGYASKPYEATSGVPQGSHLGPVLFLIFINDIVDSVHHSECSLFADDMKVYKEIQSGQDAHQLQDDLNRIKLWCTTNDMLLNPAKCYHIKFTKNKRLIPSSYLIGTDTLEEVRQIRDLGVVLDAELNFRAHYDSIIAKSLKMLGFLRRTATDFKKVSTKKVLFNALVRSCLEFASVVWNPGYQVHRDRIERVQRAFTRHLAYHDPKVKYNTDYESRLRHFSMVSLANRRLVHDQVFLYKLINNQISLLEIQNMINLSVPRLNSRRVHVQTFSVPLARTVIKRQAPFTRLLTSYNDIANDACLDIYHDNIRTYTGKLVKYVTPSNE
jgi:hypothetical protein